MRQSATILLCLLWAAAAPAVQPAPTDSSQSMTPLPRPRSRIFPPRISTLGMLYLPDGRYSRESSLGLGAQVARLFRFGMDPHTPPSELHFKAMFTFKGQKELEGVASLHFPRDRHSLKLKLYYDDIPLRFWGLGPDTPDNVEEVYRPRSNLAYLEYMHTLHARFKLGFRCEYENLELIDVKPGGLLDRPTSIPGTEGRSVVGAGIIAAWDTRDRIHSPTRGSYYQGFALWFDGELGSQYDFNTYNVDLRNYIPLTHGHVLATQIFLYAAMGGSPFWRYAALGGRAHTRGYRRGRYLDHTLLAFQGEYHFPLWRRMGGVTFAGLGDVAKNVGRMKLRHMRPTVGAGLRIQPKKAGDIKIRFDAAIGESSLRFYLGLDEAF